MELITIYKISCYQADEENLLGDSFSLSPWDDSRSGFDGEDDGGREYVLPQGYSFVLDEGVPLIVNEQRFSCALQDYNGLPVLVDSVKKQAILLEKDKKCSAAGRPWVSPGGNLRSFWGLPKKNFMRLKTEKQSRAPAF